MVRLLRHRAAVVTPLAIRGPEPFAPTAVGATRGKHTDGCGGKRRAPRCRLGDGYAGVEKLGHRSAELEEFGDKWVFF